MKAAKLFALILALPLLVQQGARAQPCPRPMGTAFTYQGFLTFGNTPITDSCIFDFELWDCDVDGNWINGLSGVPLDVLDGHFTVQLDFMDVYNGDARFLDIWVYCPEVSGDVVHLSPRTELTPTPYAIYAEEGGAGGADDDWDIISNEPDMFAIPTGNVGIGTSTPEAKLHIHGTTRLGGVATIATGTRIQAEHAGGARILGSQGHTAATPAIGFFSTNGVDDGAGGNGIFRPLANEMAFATQGTERMRIHAGGNVGIGILPPNVATEKLDVAGNVHASGDISSGGTIRLLGNDDCDEPDYVRATDVMELYVYETIACPDGIADGYRALRLDKGGTNADQVNLIGGHVSNNVTAGVDGGTISGGGTSGFPNSVTDDFGTVGGGLGNTSRRDATVGGGAFNEAQANWATIAGGLFNIVHSGGSEPAQPLPAEYGTIGGGLGNQVGLPLEPATCHSTSRTYATVGGGQENKAMSGWCTIGGGLGNKAGGMGDT